MSDLNDNTDAAGAPVPAVKVARKPRRASRMVVGVEMTLREAILEMGVEPSSLEIGGASKLDTTNVVVLKGRGSTPKSCVALAEKLALTGCVVGLTERVRFVAGVRQQWFKGVAS